MTPGSVVLEIELNNYIPVEFGPKSPLMTTRKLLDAHKIELFERTLACFTRVDPFSSSDDGEFSLHFTSLAILCG